MNRATIIILLLFHLLINGCNTASEVSYKTGFSKLDSSSTGVDFINQLEYNEKFNVYTYRNFYNGGGVAIGDLNNDGLSDIYFTSNLGSNRLFLNKGDMKFEDITEVAGVGGNMGWSTGVTMADVNGDGLLDIYVCNSGDIEGDKKKNELFINNGDLTFSENAAGYHLDDAGYGTHASFFDYDKDGDLDVYLLNNSYQAIGSFNLERNERNTRDSLGGDKLLEFNGKYFEDVSQKAGIYGSIIGFGLGVTVGDINKDGWEDIYVSNDFFERDYLYVNNQDGTFSETLKESMNSISGASMGADLADINNDTYVDLFVTEMLPGDYKRLKSVTTFENFDKYSYNVKNGYYHQFTRNTLQLNNQNQSFSEIGRYSGVEASDWSWGALIFDMDNDGLKDLFIANGIYQDLTDQDYLNYISNEEIAKSVITDQGVDYKKLIDIIPSNPVSNKAYRNGGDLNFLDFSKNYGLDDNTFSNGAAYGDLDNDGDLDLVVNNVNATASIFQNNRMSQPDSSFYLGFRLEGLNMNSFGIGAQITVSQNDKTYYVEQQPTRGFQSSSDPRPFVGLPNSTPVDILVRWSSGLETVLRNVNVNQYLTLEESSAKNGNLELQKDKNKDIFTLSELDIEHHENEYVDFNRDRLKYHMQSTEGPNIAVADVNGDGLDDFYLGGARGYTGKIIYSLKEGGYNMDSTSFINEMDSEDAGASFFDADGDGDLDLYVCTGSSEFSSSSALLKDKLYFNNEGVFTLSSQLLPSSSSYKVTSTVVPIDFDMDNDMDLFVGERLKPFQYGMPSSGYLLENNGNGEFSEVLSLNSTLFKDIGMIRDVEQIDMDGDGDQDLIVVGEYMGLNIYLNHNGSFSKSESSLSNLRGWWNVIKAVDIDNDGDIDLVAGNHGLNSRFKASAESPIVLVIDDFDNNGSVDPILAKTHADGKLYPFGLRHNLADQLKFILKKYPDYKSFKEASLDQILGDTAFNNSKKYEINTLTSVVIINEGNLNFTVKELPNKAQFSTIYAIESADFDSDGDNDLLLGGNLYGVKPEVGRYDATSGVFLENIGDGEFRSYADDKGFNLSGEIRSIKLVNNKIIVGRNNKSLIEVSFNE